MTGVSLGFGLPVSGSWATPPTMVRVARRAEQLGYASLWTFQRLLVPAGDDMGPQYRSVHDPLVALAYVAGATERVRLGVAVVNLPFYSPVVLAKQLTTLDAVSAGRLDVGLGLGWVREEFVAAGAPYEGRGKRAEEFVACLKTIWTQDPVSYDGELYQVPPSRIEPKPVQRPHPPLLLGGAAEPALRRAGRFADGWLSASRHDLAQIGTAVDTIRSAAREAGRDAGRLRFVVRGVVSLDAEQYTEDGSRRPLTGSAKQIHDDLTALGDAGITEVFLDLNFNPRVGSPDADPEASLAHAEEVLAEFAPRSA